MPTAEIERSYIPREVVGSGAFNLEYLRKYSDESIRKDVITYLGEYRFKIQKQRYDLYYLPDVKSGVPVICGPDGESMRLKSERAIIERNLRGDPTHREKSESLGLLKLERQLGDAKEDDMVFWASPPGPQAEGYGDYGFIYIGRKEKDASINTELHKNTSGTRLSMTAVRVENPTIEEYNRAMTLLTGNHFDFDSADEFLSSPLTAPQIAEVRIDEILRQEFDFLHDQRRQQEFEKFIDFSKPLIDRVIYDIQFSDKQKKLASFYALENYMLGLKNRKLETVLGEKREYYFEKFDVDKTIAILNFKPPPAKGSCGSTGSPISNSLFGTLSSINGSGSLLDQREPFKCPKCSFTTHSPVGNRCPGCGLTKEQYAEEMGGEVCD